jgi:hypothetical protein
MACAVPMIEVKARPFEQNTSFFPLLYGATYDHSCRYQRLW